MLFQSLAIPHVLDRKNTLITAETGNGKTLAFIAPMLQQIAEIKKVQSDPPMNSPRGLVIVPSKELATQIYVSPFVCMPSPALIPVKQLKESQALDKENIIKC